MGECCTPLADHCTSHKFSAAVIFQQQLQSLPACAGMYAEGAGHPVFGKAEFSPRSVDLKHLEFLRAYGHYYYAKVAYAYNSSCACLPVSCRAGLRTIETRVNTISGPLLSGLQQGSERMLWTLDSKVAALPDASVQLGQQMQCVQQSAHSSCCCCALQVDTIVRVTQQAMHPKALSEARAEHSLAVAECTEARRAYLQKIEETVQFLRDNGISGAARHAMSALLRRLDEAQKLPTHMETEALPVVSGVGDAWSKLAAIPPGMLLTHILGRLLGGYDL